MIRVEANAVGDWIVSADVLARSRFLVSPMHETVAAMTALDRQFDAADRAFAALHREAYDAMLEAHPVRRELGQAAWRPRTPARAGWMADFLGPAPSAPGMDIEAQLDELAREWPDDRIRHEVQAVTARPLPDALRRHGLTEELVGLLRWVWTATVEADWPRRERVLHADIVARTALLATKGWASVISTLGRGRAWVGGGRITINGYDLPDRDLTGAQNLWFIPVHCAGAWVGWQPPERYALVYPVTGTGLAPASPEPGALGRLLGDNRARTLALLDGPRSTTHLVGLTGLPAASVSRHLHVLLESGLVQRRRSGRDVLYWRSALGEGLVRAHHAQDSGTRT